MKKFFRLLAATALLFTIVACNNNATDFGQIGTISGGDVAYDATTGKVSKELTINLNGAKVTSKITAGTAVDLTIIGPTITDIEGEEPSITAVEEIKADATSFKIKLEGFVASIETLSGNAVGTTEAYDGSFVLELGTDFTISDKSKLPYVSGGKFTGLRQTAYGSGSGSGTTITVNLTGATYTTDLVAADLKLVSVAADKTETAVTISSVGAKKGTPDGVVTITTSETLTSGTSYKLTISNPSSHFTAEKDTTETAKDAYVVPTKTMTVEFDAT